MAADLGAGWGEVHEKAREVLDFWFGEVPADKRFAKDDAIDSAIAARFGALIDDLLARRAAGWREDADTVLAAIIVLDQFTRNSRRGAAAAFAGDAVALELSRWAIERGLDEALARDRRVFLYMPLMHAEDRTAQAQSLERFETLGIENNVKFARDHAAVIDRFGRFPSRNAALGRRSTPDELDYLSQPGVGW